MIDQFLLGVEVAMSRVVRFYELGGPDVLKIETRDIPAPEAGEVLVQVDAIGLNRADVMFRRGQYLEKAVLPSQLGFESVGRVMACGAGATRFRDGDKVSTLPGFDLSRYGVYADHIIIPEAHLLRHPDGLSDTEGAALWMACLTAYGGLMEAGGLRQGDWVLVSAATSSVGLAAIQIAKYAGASVVATSLTSAVHKTLLAMGADVVIATREEPLEEKLMASVGGRLNVAFDAVGGPDVVDIAEAMAPDGRLVIHGALSPESTPFPLKIALRKSLSFRGYVYTEVTSNPDTLARAHRFLSEGVAAGALRPRIDRIFSLDDVVKAHEYLESNQQFGKVVMAV